MVASRSFVRGEAGVAQRWMETVARVTSPLYGTASAVILVTGIYLVLDSSGAYSFGSTFVAIGLGVLVLGGALGGLVFSRQSKLAAALYQTGKPAETAPIHRNIAFWGTVDTLLIALVVLVMVAKWGA
jgi:hypothetical protein